MRVATGCPIIRKVILAPVRFITSDDGSSFFVGEASGRKKQAGLGFGPLKTFAGAEFGPSRSIMGSICATHFMNGASGFGAMTTEPCKLARDFD
jgi:hypothetical protein